jgi:hypothetical protein
MKGKVKEVCSCSLFEGTVQSCINSVKKTDTNYIICIL